MGTKRTTTVEETDDKPGSVLDEIALRDVEDDEISAADALIDEVRGETDATVNIHRIGAGRGKEPFLFACAPEDIVARDLMERCQTEYGGGDFKMVIRDNQKIVRSARFSVEVPKKPPEPEKQDGLGMAELLVIMQQSNDRMLSMFQTTMQSFAEAFKGSRENQPSFDPVAANNALIQNLAALKTMTDPAKQKDPVEMLIQGMTLMKDFTGKDGETNSNDILLKGLEMFAPTIADATRAGLERQAGGVPGAPTPPGDSQAATDAEKERALGMQKVIQRQQLGWLVKQANAAKEPALYAELLLDQVGEPAVLEFIAKPDAMEQLIALEPAVANFKPWFEALKSAILELTADEDDLTDHGNAGENGTGGVTIEGEGTRAVPDPDGSGDTTVDTPGAGGNP